MLGESKFKIFLDLINTLKRRIDLDEWIFEWRGAGPGSEAGTACRRKRTGCK